MKSITNNYKIICNTLPPGRHRERMLLRTIQPLLHPTRIQEECTEFCASNKQFAEVGITYILRKSPITRTDDPRSHPELYTPEVYENLLQMYISGGAKNAGIIQNVGSGIGNALYNLFNRKLNLNQIYSADLMQYIINRECTSEPLCDYCQLFGKGARKVIPLKNGTVAVYNGRCIQSIFNTGGHPRWPPARQQQG